MPQSYLADARYDINPLHVLRQLLDYVASEVLPYLHLFEAPVVPFRLPHEILWILRFLILLALVLMVWRSAEKKHNDVLCLLALGVLPLLPIIVLSGPPQGRYVYCSVAFMAILLAWVLCGRAAITRFLRPAVALLQVWMWTGFYKSPSIVNFLRMTHDVEVLVGQLPGYCKEWPEGSTITILNHPHPGTAPYRWVYVQHLVAIFCPETSVTVALDRVPGAYKTYRFENGELVAL
ncbi:MAG: hypothetical protein ACR2IE_07520 [Candidatus Sumerlaeaceae bacterium]